MKLIDWIQLIIAGWGAILSSILGVREIFRAKRQVRVYLEHIHWVERLQVIVVNIGHRPVTITSVAARPIPDISKGMSPSEAKPFYPTPLEEDGDIELPVVLKDGESVSYFLPELALNMIYVDGIEIEAYARDAEGKEYTTKRMRKLDAKYDKYIE